MASRRILEFESAPAAPLAIPLTGYKPGSWLMPGRMQAGLQLLFDACENARALSLDRWEFSVELSELQGLGLTINDCRWLVAQGWVKHARETTAPESVKRTFSPCPNLKFTPETCFVLTESGYSVARGASAHAADISRPVIPAEALDSARSAALGTVNGAVHALVPKWDRDRQELRVGRQIVKQFKVPAANQETILAAFEEEQWPPRIDDPLTLKANLDPKRRLHDTINSLNRNQKRSMIRFFGDGSGQGIRWEFTVENPGCH
jgi:hypothetical protein